MWIGDFVRGHTVVRVLKQRWPNRPVDLLTTRLCAPLVDYMPGVRAGIVWDLPRSRLALAQQWELAAQLRAAALRHRAGPAPHLEVGDRAGSGRHPGTGRLCRRGRFGLINRWRWGEKALPRFIDKNAALALPDGAPLPPEWPVPQLRVPAGRGRALAAGQRPRHRSGGGAGARLGRRLQALDLLPRGRAPAGRRGSRRLGGRRPRRKGAGAGDRRRRRPEGPRSHRQRSAQRHSGDGRGQRRDLQRFRADAYRRRASARRPWAFSARPALISGRR